MDREIQEAILAGERALESLNDAKDELKSARGWGIFDILGGGLLATAMKHNRMDDASDDMESTWEDLKDFRMSFRM